MGVRTVHGCIQYMGKNGKQIQVYREVVEDMIMSGARVSDNIIQEATLR